MVKHAKVFLVRKSLENQAQLIIDSYQHWTGTTLVNTPKELYLLQKPVLSHNTMDDPVFNFANIAAQELFEMELDIFLSTPSKYSAEQIERKDRDHLLRDALKNGIIDNYEGIRISSTGKRFHIKKTQLFNLIGSSNKILGQAAIIGGVTPINA